MTFDKSNNIQFSKIMVSFNVFIECYSNKTSRKEFLVFLKISSKSKKWYKLHMAIYLGNNCISDSYQKVMFDPSKYATHSP